MEVAMILGVAVVAVTALLTFSSFFNKWYYEPVLKPGQPPLPPGSLGWPVFGNMAAFLRAFKSGRPDTFMAHYVAKYNRVGFYKAFLFWQPTVLAATPEACKFVLSKDSFETGWPESAVELMGRNSFAGLTGESHFKLRKLTEPAVNSPKALEQYVPLIVNNIKACLARWSAQDKIVLLTEMRRFTFLTVLHILYGKDSSLDVDETFSLYYIVNQGIRALPINFPGTAYNKALKARRKLIKLIQDVINQRRASGKPQETNILSLLMDQLDDKGEALEDAQIIDVLNMYMNAGHDSTAHVIMWLMIFLKRNPDVLEKVKTEQDGIAKCISEGEMLNLSDIKRMRYLSSVVDETLRLANISPMVFRRALVDVEFNGFTIPKGWHAEAWLRQVHMDPHVHPDPEKFDPERWEKYGASPFTFMPFGMGNRTCPGNELAKLQIFIVVHYFVTGYRWTALNPNSKVSYLPHPRPRDFYSVRVSKLL
ncbi:ent-kaurenoic acid oxidase 1 isoform X2 [Selaginella moellendorffii]|nr:ent-kaurenoic acid oxidase 1 isoform X2 [Selaginella moellendorffii]|eukprot:XP_002988455.2 ent-kaurenoic acid oxidase 1 isoform X2 [Selaginella moellendorffii]